MSKDGFDNETRICEQLNQKRFKELSLNFQVFAKSIDSSIQDNDVIYCEKCGKTFKSDLSVTIKGKSYGVSVKVGSGNSVHQESIETFSNFLIDNLNAKLEIVDCIKKYIWGDGTVDGTGPKENRINSKSYVAANNEELNKIQTFFDENLESLLVRILKKGKYGTGHAEYLYYGDSKNGIIININNAIEYLKKKSLNTFPHIGGLTFQAWNRNINGGDKSEDKRGQIQLKWGNLKSDIKKIYEQ